MNNIVFAGKRENALERVEHNHKQWEIIYCLKSGELCTDRERISYKRGDVVIIPPLVKHANCGAAAGDLLILMEQALLPFKRPEIILNADEGIYFAFCQAAERFSAGKDSDGVMSALGGLIAAYLSEAKGVTFSPVVESVRADVAKNLSNCGYSLEDFMRSLPLNYDYIRKLFKKETGVTPHEYLISARMELAKNIITSGISNRYSSYSVSQISETCGFAEPLYFSRVFKKYYGVSPAAYAERVKNGEF